MLHCIQPTLIEDDGTDHCHRQRNNPPTKSIA
jgi:hypothetical protein